jgi:hypothetical protein
MLATRAISAIPMAICGKSSGIRQCFLQRAKQNSRLAGPAQGPVLPLPLPTLATSTRFAALYRIVSPRTKRYFAFRLTPAVGDPCQAILLFAAHSIAVPVKTIYVRADHSDWPLHVSRAISAAPSAVDIAGNGDTGAVIGITLLSPNWCR